MDKNKKAIESIDEYIAQFPPAVQEKLNELRKVILEVAPEAEERIRYEVPTFAILENMVNFAVRGHHIRLYLSRGGIEAFRADLTGYKTSKDTVLFSLDQPLPYDLIGRMVRFMVGENVNKAKAEPKARK